MKHSCLRRLAAACLCAAALLLPARVTGETWLLEDLDIGPCRVRMEADPLTEELIEVRIERVSEPLGPLPLGFTLYDGADVVGAAYESDGSWIGYAECRTDTLTVVPFYDGYEDPAYACMISGQMAGVTDVSRWEVFAQRGVYLIEGTARVENGVCAVRISSGASSMSADPIVSWDLYADGNFAGSIPAQPLDDKGVWVDRRLAQGTLETGRISSLRAVPVTASGSSSLKLGADFYRAD